MRECARRGGGGGRLARRPVAPRLPERACGGCERKDRWAHCRSGDVRHCCIAGKGPVAPRPGARVGPAHAPPTNSLARPRGPHSFPSRPGPPSPPPPGPATSPTSTQHYGPLPVPGRGPAAALGRRPGQVPRRWHRLLGCAGGRGGPGASGVGGQSGRHRPPLQAPWPGCGGPLATARPGQAPAAMRGRVCPRRRARRPAAPGRCRPPPICA